MARSKNNAFDPDLLAAMCSHVKIPSKEPGKDNEEEESGSMLIDFDPLLPTQSYVTSQIAAGLKEGIHTFYVLKCRQSGITTIGLAAALMWCFLHDGMIFTFIADNSKRLFYNRRLARQFVNSLRKHPEWRQETDEDNREVLSFKNGSAIFWSNANSDDEGGLGRSMGVPGIWGTELGLWRDEEGVLSLMSSMSENQPKALYVFEGTARGPNLFKELYELASESTNTSQRAIFVGWWLHPWYEHDLKNPQHQKRYEVYWKTLPRLTRDEARWVEGIRVRYGFEVRPTQISWWRWHLREKKKDNLQLMYQEYPPLEEDAWSYGGSGFIDGRKLSSQTSRAVARRTTPKRYFVFDPGDGVVFTSSDLIEVDPRTHYYDLICFAEPVTGPRVRYAIGCDPAHGANEEGDHMCCQVLLCYSDKAIQVAEFVKREIPTFQIAWVILHLVGAYNSGEAETHLNIEMQGGGTEVYAEIKRLQAEMAFGYTPKLARYFQKMSHYLYTRPDSQSGKASTVHWETTGKSKIRMLHAFKNLLEREMLECASEDIIKEAAKMQLLRDGSIETPKENHRLMAMAIAGMAYLQILDMDIGGRKEYSSEALKEVHDQDPKQLNPDQFMQATIEAWKQGMLAEGLDEIEALPENPTWLEGLKEDWSEEQYYGG